MSSRLWATAARVVFCLASGCAGGLDAAELERKAAALATSARPGMGAAVYAGGTTFRVWAPYASRVWVTGDFNGWGLDELGNEFNGNFSADRAAAGVHQRYLYVLRNAWGHDTWKADPRAQ